jgi:general secretion pathway protein M
MIAALPTGPKGQALALGLTLLAVVAIWLGVVAPLLDWQADRDETLRREVALARRMTALVETLPALRDAAAEAAGSASKPGALLAGGTDALAAATLQQKLDELATGSGVRIGSEEILPPRADGDYRAVIVRVTLTAPFRGLIALLEAMARAEVPLEADDMRLRGPPVNGRDLDLPIDASFTVSAYRAAGAEAR